MTAYGVRISDWSSDVCSSDLPVLVLRLFRTRHHQTGRQMGDADRRIGRVDVLDASPGSAHRVDADVFRPDLDVDLLGLRRQRDGRRRTIGRASRREKGCQYVSIGGVATSLTKKKCYTT